MITDSKRSDGVEKWHYLALKSERTFCSEKWCNCAVKSLSRLLRGMTSNHYGDLYCLNCFIHAAQT